MTKLAVSIFLLAAICLLPRDAQADCPKPCTHILEPVCGTPDGREYRYFSNSCRMEAYNECERGAEREMHEVDLNNCDEPEW